ncbi:MAG TPA: T9SS type A sorting domain-containing protein, partial [Chitinophagaceae bacterium]|nr:T9SS type A sorting domain-containing protein [Chitinophagaceae bacterium]
VQSNCSATFNTSDFCATYHFQTTGSASKQEANSTSDISQLEKVNVYPNPTSNNIFVDIATLEESTWLLEIYDVSGRRLQSQSTLAKKGWQQINMNLNSLEESTYFLFIYKNGILTSTKKIIKQNN